MSWWPMGEHEWPPFLGAYVALGLALGKLVRKGVVVDNPLHTQLAAISVGISRRQGTHYCRSQL